MGRARKRHVQVELEFRTWGGKRRGAGRKQTRARKSEPHRRREAITPRDGVHVTLRVSERITRMRRRDAYRAIRAAMVVVLRRADFRIIHASIQANHLHLIVEAHDENALARGIQAFAISAARRLNAVEPRRNWSSPRKRESPSPNPSPRPSPSPNPSPSPSHGAVSNALEVSSVIRRRTRKAKPGGVVFPDRYHAEILTSPRRVRSALSYVLNNWRRHREDQASYTANWYLDPFSSGVSFAGWKEGTWKIPADHDPLPVSAPQSWLLREGWKKSGAISVFEVPGPRE